MPIFRSSFSSGLAAALIAVPLAVGPAGAEPPAPRLLTNEAYVEGLAAEPGPGFETVEGAFALVFSLLPDTARVFTTENYYYFDLTVGGATYHGNFRLGVEDRDDGVIHFGMFSLPRAGGVLRVSMHKAFTAADGVTVERHSPFDYGVTYKGKTVRFLLNDLSEVGPPEGTLRPSETFIGPVFDESGVRFLLVWDEAAESFRYLLDESAPSEALLPSGLSPAIEIGERTGFVFHRDPFRQRRILIGVMEWEVARNSWFDGPFDQLPDNFVDGNALRDALRAAIPELDDVDRYGNSATLGGRAVIDPYLIYRETRQFEAFSRCVKSAAEEFALYQCYEFSP